MAYTTPTAATFKLRFPEFAELADGLVDLLIAEAELFVDDRWEERDRAPAILLLAAHAALQSTLTQSALAAAAASSTSGGESEETEDDQTIKSVSFGSSSVTFGSSSKSSYFSAASSSSPGLKVGAAYVDTIYGQRFIVLQRRNIGGPLVV